MLSHLHCVFDGDSMDNDVFKAAKWTFHVKNIRDLTFKPSPADVRYHLSINSLPCLTVNYQSLPNIITAIFDFIALKRDMQWDVYK